jgi:hypothetical protein
MKGNKEFYENMQAISEYSSKQLGQISNMGSEVLENYKRNKNEYLLVDSNKKRGIVEENKDGNSNEKIIAISQKLQEIFILMKYTHPWAFQEELTREERRRYSSKKPYMLQHKQTVDNKDNNHIDIPITEVLTKAFAKEITFLYYLNLFNNFYVPLLHPNTGFDSIIQESVPSLIIEYFNMHRELTKKSATSSIHMQLDKDHYPFYLSPKEKLFLILQNDEDIKSNFSAWIEDIVNYQKETTELMSKSYLEVKDRINNKNKN